MVRGIGETAKAYAQRLEEPQREGETDEDYARRVDTRVGEIEAVHGPDHEKFINTPEGPMLKDAVLNRGTTVEGQVTRPIEGPATPSAAEGNTEGNSGSESKG